MNKSDKAKEILDGIETAIATLEQKIDSPETENQIRQWLAMQGRFHNYSLNNTYWLMAQAISRKIVLSQIASFNMWQSFHNDQGEKVSVKRGEKGFSILFPMMYKMYELDDQGKYRLDAQGNKIPKTDNNGKEVERISFGVGYVFDISQTNAKEINALVAFDHRGDMVEIDNDIITRIARNITEQYGYPVMFKDSTHQAGGWFDTEEKSITINTAVTKLPYQQLGTLFHELGHGIMHSNVPKSYSRALAEGQAEAFAYAMSTLFGVERKSEFYIKTWISGDENIRLIDVMKNLSSNLRTAAQKLDVDAIILEKQTKTQEHANENSY